MRVCIYIYIHYIYIYIYIHTYLWIRTQAMQRSSDLIKEEIGEGVARYPMSRYAIVHAYDAMHADLAWCGDMLLCIILEAIKGTLTPKVL